MGGEEHPDRAPPHVEIGVVVGRLGEEPDPDDERDRGGKVGQLEDLLDPPPAAVGLLVAGTDQPGRSESPAETDSSLNRVMATSLPPILSG